MPQPFTEQTQATGMLIQILIISKYRLGRFMVVVSSMNGRHATHLTSQSALSTKSVAWDRVVTSPDTSQKKIQVASQRVLG